MTHQHVAAPANRDAVISAIITFACTHAGFTDEGIDGGLSRISKGGRFWSFKPWSADDSTLYQIACRLTDVLPLGSTWQTVDGQDKTSGFGMLGIDTNYTGLDLFSNGVEVSAVLELVPDVFTHLSFGTIKKNWDYDGGEFVTGTSLAINRSSGKPACFNNYTPMAFDNAYSQGASAYAGAYFVNACRFNGNYVHERRDFYPRLEWTGGVQYYYHYTNNMNKDRFKTGKAAFNNRTPLLDLFALYRPDNVQLIKFIGMSNQVKFLNIEAFKNKEVIENDWMIFPYFQRSQIVPVRGEVSENRGLAYKI